MNALLELDKLTTENATIKLQPTSAADIEFVLTTEQHPDNACYVYQWTYEEHLVALTNPNIAHYLIFDNARNEPIGYLILDDVKNPSKSINLRRIVVTRKNQGIGKISLQLAKQVAFEALNANRFWLDVFVDNQNAYHLYKQVGFMEEGILRQSYLRNGEYVSQYIMAILKHEYFATKLNYGGKNE